MKNTLFIACLCILPFYSSAQSWTKLNSIPARLTFPVVDVIGGNIHVVGGGGVNGATDLHLRYKPATDSWDTLKPVPYLAQQPGGGAINGKLHYFGGGYPNSGTRLDQHYAYDVTTNSWTKLANIPIPRVIHKTAVLGDSIYVLSGQPDKKRVDVYNAKTDKWSKYNDLPDNNFWYSGITTYQDKIYRFGGGGSGAPAKECHVYNPITDSWSSLSPLPKAIHAPDAKVLGDSIFISGGYSEFSYLSGVWIYDIAADSYSQGPWLNNERSYHNMVRVDNCLYVLGGNNNSNPDSTAVSLLRYCRGEKFASMSEIGSHGQLQITQTSQFINVNRDHSQGQSVHIEIYNLLGVQVYTNNYQSDESIILDKKSILPNSGTYVCYVKQGNLETRIKISDY